RLSALRRDVPDLVEFAERMARPLLAGGDIFTPPVGAWWPSEFGYRAGGLMGIRNERPVFGARSKQDVFYFAAPDPRSWDAAKDEQLQALVKTRANLFVIGRAEDVAGVPASRFAGFTGGASPEEGLYGLGNFRPLAPLRTFEQFVRGWIAAGEMIAACTRAGKMPAVYMSIWLEGAAVRNLSFLRYDNLREPWLQGLFHRDWYIPPVPAGRVAGEFLDSLDQTLSRLVEQSSALAQAGQWLAQAKQARKKIRAVLVGHSYPAILGLPEDQASDYPLEWGRSMSDLGKAFPRNFGPGDVGLHLGYGPINVPAVRSLLARGVRLIHTTPYGPMADLKPHKNWLYFDLPWRPGDAEVNIPGYGARILPSSSSAMTMAYNAILCELAQSMGWK
ncbi:MAG: hypothetical protein NT031_18600, partial [Planctomycetota bacterium]|nr:hypothetical protein [Planctomycetota bacterium]